MTFKNYEKSSRPYRILFISLFLNHSLEILTQKHLIIFLFQVSREHFSLPRNYPRRRNLIFQVYTKASMLGANARKYAK